MPSPTIYFNLRSPYSWLALEDLAARYPQLVGALQWRPYWDPDEESIAALKQAGGKFAYTQMSREKHFYILQDVKRLAGDRGLAATWPLDRDPCWEVPHLACLAAESSGKMPALAYALSRARWMHGKNICDRDTVAAVVDSLGLNGPELAGAEADPAIRESGTRMLLAAHRDGVFGVPFFVSGRARYWGVERLEAFVSEVGSRGTDEGCRGTTDIETSHPDCGPVLLSASSSDAGHAGGCG